MKDDSNLPPAIFLMGPTASGKSDLAIRLAEQLAGEIISVDSVLVYKGMDIGTAKPTMDERAGIPHHLMDILDPSNAYSTGNFRTAALQLMEDISRRGRIPILVGGTMLYFNALLKGLAHLPEANADIRKKLDEELATLGKQVLHERLKKVDPESAERIHPNDPQRIQRALEVYEISGKPISQFFHEAQSQPMPYRPIKCIISSADRKLLHEKIAQRFKRMVDAGLIEEVRTLYQRGDLTPDLPAIRAVGYRQTWSYLQGEYDLEMMIEKGIIATRQLAKRQFTWLRRETDFMQFDAFEKDLPACVLQQIKPLI
ncbi:MAG: tRNA (adenosine(37)-N6)-dimethylallyltransferase MiaA [Methylococcales bacterium]|nr:tRNA (adenosine(37)-N6)-dimethylallyltransferase MiaA [Methylococcaceae bacterium]